MKHFPFNTNIQSVVCESNYYNSENYSFPGIQLI